jgi:hypothetical protein
MAFLGLERTTVEAQAPAPAVASRSDEARPRRPEPGLAARLRLSQEQLAILALVSIAFCWAILRSLLRLRLGPTGAIRQEPTLGD